MLYNKLKRRKAAILLIAVALTATWYINNFTIAINRLTLTSEKVSAEFKICLISDLHGARFGKNNERLISKIKREQPDVIFELGDMYSHDKLSGRETALELLTTLTDIAEVYAVSGEHDIDHEFLTALESLGVHSINYRTQTVTIKGNTIHLYGINNRHFSDNFDLSREFDRPSDDELNLLLSHIPSMESYGDFGFDCVFSGDTHGGLIRLPILGGLYFRGYMLPEITYNGKITDKGLFEFENSKIFVTSGLGGYPLRFNNRPELCIITYKGE